MTKDKQINVILFNQIVVNSGVEVEMSALPPQHGPGGGGGTPHMKGVGMLVGNFELNP